MVLASKVLADQQHALLEPNITTDSRNKYHHEYTSRNYCNSSYPTNLVKRLDYYIDEIKHISGQKFN
jgi:hypothetical protein